MEKENKLLLKGTNNKIINNIFSKKFDYLEKKILVSRLPPLYNLEINHIYTSHISQRRNSIKYLHSINKIVLNNKLKNENIVENYNSILGEISQSKDFIIKKSFFELAKIREISNIWDYSHDYCDRIVSFYSSRFVILKGKNLKKNYLNEENLLHSQRIFDGHRNKIGTFAVHPKSN